MDNHHLALQNTSGRMSDCMKLLNGNYGAYFRKKYGGKGYMFQSRYKSTLIEKESYLIQSIIYLLENPVRAGMVENAEVYPWSSFFLYFSTDDTQSFVDKIFVDELFETKTSLLRALNSNIYKKPQLVITTNKYGEFWGSDNFIKKALKQFNRRLAPTEQSISINRIDDGYFEPVEKIIMEFEIEMGLKVMDIDIGRHSGK